jgi:tetratricopeptide (TPR) repeat protein
MIKLNCPSCSGALELPDNLGIVHCMYCGTKILLQQAGIVQDKSGVERYTELRKVAVEAKNYDEAIRYCNAILEIDPTNIEAWIDKAISTFWLTTGANNRYDEAMEYLRKAAQLAPHDSRVDKAREELTDSQAWWYNKLGVDNLELAIKVRDIYQPDGLSGLFSISAEAKEHSREHFADAMNKFLMASTYRPNDLTILDNISTCQQKADWINWGNQVDARIRRRDLLRAKAQAERYLPELREALQSAQSLLAAQKKEKGIFVGFKIRDTEGQIQLLRAEIAEQKRIAEPKLPDV